MPHDMFGEVVRPSVRVGSRAWYTVPLSIAVHVALAVVVIVVPLMATDALPKPTSLHKIFVGDPPEAPPPPVAPSSPAQVRRAPVSPDAAPVDAPSTIEKEVAAPLIPNVGPVMEGGLPAGLVGEGGIAVVSPVIPVPPPPLTPAKPVPVGGHIAVPIKIRDVRPVYPSDGADIEGVGHRHDRGDDRRRRACEERAGHQVDRAPRSGCAGRGQTVAVLTDPAQRRADPGDHDGDGKLRTAVGGDSRVAGRPAI